MIELELKAKKAFELREKYLRLYESNQDTEAKSLELEYLALRREVILESDNNIHRQKSIPMSEIKRKVNSKTKPKRIETGILSLDRELVSDEMKLNNQIGGLALGNFIQIAGSKGTGKSSFMLKIMTGFSLYEKVCWFDFEMGEDRVVSKLKAFEHDDENLLYYGASRKLSDIVDEIKFLNAIGVNHFVIDSAMKITVGGADRYDKFSTISGELSSLTSTLGINIYMINQMSQSAERDGHLSIKHGNDAEYDADFIFFLLNAPVLDENNKPVLDDAGIPKKDENKRILKCEKNRQDERLFSINIPKHEIIKDSSYSFPVEVSKYEMEII